MRNKKYLMFIPLIVLGCETEPYKIVRKTCVTSHEEYYYPTVGRAEISIICDSIVIDTLIEYRLKK